MIAFLPVVLLLLPSGLSYPADENMMGDGALMYPDGSFSPNKPPKGCFHFYVSRNMSSLLSDATKMLPQVRDRREREWILTFIYRIKSLAEHLRTHPSSRNYDCIASDPRDTLYFEDDLPQKRSGDNQSPRSQPEESPGTVQSGSHQGLIQSRSQSPTNQGLNNQRDATLPHKEQTESHQDLLQSSNLKGSVESGQTEPNQDSVQTKNQEDSAQSHQEQPGSNQDFTQSSNQMDTDHQASSVQSGGQTDHAIVISSSPDCEENSECEEALSRQAAARAAGGHSDDLLVQELHSRHQEKNHQEEDRMQQKVLKERIRRALLQEMASEVKKLRTVGGSEEDLINLWKQSESDTVKPSENFYEFDYEETGTAAGDLNDSNDSSTPLEQTVAPSLGDLRRQSNRGKTTQPYDDSDVLVKQLFDVRFEQSKQSTKSIDNKEEYLITSTHVPY